MLQKLETKALGFSVESHRLKLMRRAYLDLIGLPPSPGEIASYVTDTRPVAYERLIDKLLASTHYGEGRLLAQRRRLFGFGRNHRRGLGAASRLALRGLCHSIFKPGQTLTSF
jgi:hypothetical protein